MKTIVISMIAVAGLMVAGSVFAADMPEHAKKMNCTTGCGSVVVTNTPLLVRDADHPGRHSFQASCSNLLSAPGQLDCVLSKTVPPNRLLVIETVTAGFAFSAGGMPASLAVETTTSGLVAEHQLVSFPVATAIQTVYGPVDSLTVSESVRLYADAGSTVTVKVVPARVVPHASIYSTISGYLVECGAGPDCPLP